MAANSQKVLFLHEHLEAGHLLPLHFAKLKRPQFPNRCLLCSFNSRWTLSSAIKWTVWGGSHCSKFHTLTFKSQGMCWLANLKLHPEIQVVVLSGRQSRCIQVTCAAAVHSYFDCSSVSETGDRLGQVIPDIWRKQMMSSKTNTMNSFVN